jgi:hypothetical protein
MADHPEVRLPSAAPDRPPGWFVAAGGKDPTSKGWATRKDRRLLWMAGAIVGVVLCALLGLRLINSSSRSGDPGGHVLSQLASVISAIPSTATKSYVWKMEPTQDSCDGRPGTQGWSEVVVQSAFKWPESEQSLSEAMAARLASLGWGQPAGSIPGSTAWAKTLANGSVARLTVDSEGTYWQLDAIAPPIGAAATGC